jgi:cytochrome c551/c552
MRKFLSLLLVAMFILTAAAVFAQDGKALFTSKGCVACHTIGGGKLVGPDLKGVTERYKLEWIRSFVRSSQTMVKNGDPTAVKLFEENGKVPMPDNVLSDQELDAILAFVKAGGASAADKASEAKPAVADPSFLENKKSYLLPSYTMWFVVFVLIMILSIVDLLFTKFLRTRFLHIMAILISGYVLYEITTAEAKNIGRTPGYEPDQPIKFSHKVHAGENKIDCKYCHFSATEGKHSGIPSAQLCLNCHNVIKKGVNTGETEIAKILEANKTGKQIKWVKVHNLPDHVFFSHAQHVNAGKLDCTACHGDVANMGRLQQVNDLSMGWCISCHRTQEVNFKSNKYYDKFLDLHAKLKSGEIKKVTPEDVGANDCQKCHY